MISVQNLTLGYESNSKVIDDISFKLSPNKITTIVGANGCGKSTLLKAMTRCLKPLGGSIQVDKEDINLIKTKMLARKIAILPQSPKAPDDFSVYDLVAQGRYPHLDWRGRLQSDDKEVVDWAMKVTHVTDYSHRMVSTLSGGERQRVFLAMALAQKPEVLFLDEPTTHLDISHQFEVLELVRKLNMKLGITIVMVLHDLNQAIRYSDEIMVLDSGSIYAHGSSKQVVDRKLCEEVFGIDVFLTHDDIHDSTIVIPIGSKAGAI